jgi:hypothetical protein
MREEEEEEEEEEKGRQPVVLTSMREGAPTLFKSLSIGSTTTRQS